MANDGYNRHLANIYNAQERKSHDQREKEIEASRMETQNNMGRKERELKRELQRLQSAKNENSRRKSCLEQMYGVDISQIISDPDVNKPAKSKFGVGKRRPGEGGPRQKSGVDIDTHPKGETSRKRRPKPGSQENALDPGEGPSRQTKSHHVTRPKAKNRLGHKGASEQQATVKVGKTSAKDSGKVKDVTTTAKDADKGNAPKSTAKDPGMARVGKTPSRKADKSSDGMSCAVKITLTEPENIQEISGEAHVPDPAEPTARSQQKPKPSGHAQRGSKPKLKMVNSGADYRETHKPKKSGMGLAGGSGANLGASTSKRKASIWMDTSLGKTTPSAHTGGHSKQHIAPSGASLSHRRVSTISGQAGSEVIDEESLEHYYQALAKSEAKLRMEDSSFEVPGGSHPPLSTLKRSHHRKVHALESILKQLPSYKSKQNDIDPLALLNCSYLRLTKDNVEELEEMCYARGQDPGIHRHMTEQEVSEQLSAKYEKEDRQKRAQEAGESSSDDDEEVIQNVTQAQLSSHFAFK